MSRHASPPGAHGSGSAGYDAALHLLDRQIVGSDGLLAGKVDDIELTEDGAALVPTGLMVGMEAWLPRLGHRLGRWLNTRRRQVRVAQAESQEPSVVDLDLVAEIASAVRLSVPRDGLLRARADLPDGAVRRRVGELFGMRVEVASDLAEQADRSWPRRTRVLDVRLSDAPDRVDRVVVSGLVVGAGRPGALLGYDRDRVVAPRVVAALVGRLHRHTRLVAWGPGVEVAWDDHSVRLDARAMVSPVRVTDDDSGGTTGQDAG